MNGLKQGKLIFKNILSGMLIVFRTAQPPKMLFWGSALYMEKDNQNICRRRLQESIDWQYKKKSK